MEFSTLAKAFQALEKTSKRLRKTYIIAELLKKTPASDLEEVLTLIEGRVFPAWDERVIGVSDQLVLKIIQTATGTPIEHIKKSWSTTGDLGIVTEELLAKHKQLTLTRTTLTIQKIINNLQQLASIEGKGSVDKKISLMTELITSATPNEAKYLIKIILGNLRVGTAAGSIRDAIVWAYFAKEIKFEYDEKDNTFTVERELYDRYANAAQHAYDVTNDFGEVAVLAKKEGIEGLERASIKIGRAHV